jgi:hypothetical protein
MYYLYHIKDVKWGCTKNLESRLKKQGYTMMDCDRVITVSGLDKAADMEKELNISHGYPWNDSVDYRVIIKAGELAYKNKQRVWNGYLPKYEQCALGGYITGKKKGFKQQKARKNNVAKINIYRTCPHCNLTSRGVAYFRYHGNNCKHQTLTT